MTQEQDRINLERILDRLKECPTIDDRNLCADYVNGVNLYSGRWGNDRWLSNLRGDYMKIIVEKTARVLK